MPSEFMTAQQCENFLGRLDVLTDEQCWIWWGEPNHHGYGRVKLGRKSVRAHRVVWRWEFGDIPPGRYVCHHCDEPACCNPNHLFLGTQKENMDDCGRKGRRAIGERSGAAKLTEKVVMEIRAMHRGGAKPADIARHYSITPQSIAALLTGVTWGWLPEETEARVVELPPVHGWPGRQGEGNTQVKLTEVAVLEIRRLRKQGVKGREIARRFNIAPSNVSQITLRHSWAHVPEKP